MYLEKNILSNVMQWFMELIFKQNRCKRFFCSYSTLDGNGIEKDTDEGSILFAWKYADKCQLYLKNRENSN